MAEVIGFACSAYGKQISVAFKLIECGWYHTFNSHITFYDATGVEIRPTSGIHKIENKTDVIIGTPCDVLSTYAYSFDKAITSAWRVRLTAYDLMTGAFIEPVIDQTLSVVVSSTQPLTNPITFTPPPDTTVSPTGTNYTDPTTPPPDAPTSVPSTGELVTANVPWVVGGLVALGLIYYITTPPAGEEEARMWKYYRWAREKVPAYVAGLRPVAPPVE